MRLGEVVCPYFKIVPGLAYISANSLTLKLTESLTPFRFLVYLSAAAAGVCTLDKGDAPPDTYLRSTIFRETILHLQQSMPKTCAF